jgi:hypothetical protein
LSAVSKGSISLERKKTQHAIVTSAKEISTYIFIGNMGDLAVVDCVEQSMRAIVNLIVFGDAAVL